MTFALSFSLPVRPLAAACVLLAVALVIACGGGSDNTGSGAIAQDVTTPTPIATPAPTTPTPSPTPTPTLIAVATQRNSTIEPTFPHIASPTPAPTPVASLGDKKLYIALGDSLSTGQGASDPGRTGFVPLVSAGLGSSYETLNLGVDGDTSADILTNEVDQAVSEIGLRQADNIANNDVSAITLEVGGNDLLNLYFDLVVPGTCPSVPEALQKEECVDGLRAALDAYKPNLESAIDSLQAADPNVPIFIETLYNPFSGGSVNLDQIAQLALEGQANTPFPDGLNDVVREVAQEKGVTVVDWYPIFVGKVNDYISGDLIHPNDTGYRLMAQAVLAAMAQQGLP